ncbi:alpha/beta hydrolase domain-containing protein [Natrinema soli]|uniref:Alpha/beta hydrolase domain-containing protein n=1 Tax=Natrinema soli TaxID=1930624 RepID=A0ABD5SIF7_9EURY|nr:alpha/beta hydrolase domain-containing protein [Natrinema soli]
MTAGSLFSAVATAGNQDEVPAPKVMGPLSGQPMTGAVHDVSEHGYIEEEYFVQGKARPLGPVNPYPIDQRESPSEKPAPYRTRVLIYRPAYDRGFNGTLVAEWPNVSTGRDAPVTWINTFDYAMREGYAFAVASSQKVGVDDSHTDQDLKTAQPDRYGSLHHPGDEYSYDIFAQAIQALTRSSNSKPGHTSKKRKSNAPLRDLDVERVVATGMSQSAQYLRYYINNIQAEQDLIDGFLPFVTAETPADQDDIWDDLAPVMWVMSESEANQVRREDSGLFRLWEVSGASHINYWLVHWAQAMDARDFGEDNPPWNRMIAGQYGQRAEGDPGTSYDVCGVNYFPMRYAYRAAMDQLQDWLIEGEAPPSAPRIERTVADDGSVTVARDQYGNAKGGLRLPVLDVPLVYYDISCGTYGSTHRLEEETINSLYSDRQAYIEELECAVDETVDSGYLLVDDAMDLLRRAQRADVTV